MRPGSSELVGSLRERVHREIETSPVLTAAQERERKARRLPIDKLLLAVFQIVACVLMVSYVPLLLGIVCHGLGRAAGLGVVALAVTGVSCLFATFLWTQLHASRALVVLGPLPISDGDFLRLQGFWTLVWSLAIIPLAAMSYTTIATYGALPPEMVEKTTTLSACLKHILVVLPEMPWLTIMAISVLQWLVALTVASILLVPCPRLLLGVLGLTFAFGYPLILFCWAMVASQADLPVPAAGQWLLDLPNRATPAGWLGAGWQLACVGDNSGAARWIAPACCLLIVLPVLWRRLRHSYRIEEIDFSCVGAEALRSSGLANLQSILANPLSILAIPGKRAAAAIQAPNRLSGDELAADVRCLLAQELDSDWSQCGLVERLAACWLTEREQAIASGLLAGEQPRWTYYWILAVPITLAALLLVMMAPFPLSLIVCLGLPWFYLVAPLRWGPASWRGFFTSSSAGQFSSLPAFAPIGFFETSRMMGKITLVQALFLLPLFGLAGSCLAWQRGVPLHFCTLPGFLGAVAALYATCLYHPCIVVWYFAEMTSLSSIWQRIGVHVLTVIGFVLTVVVVALVSGFTGPMGQFVLIVVMFQFWSVGAWRYYGWAYDRGRGELYTSNLGSYAAKLVK